MKYRSKKELLDSIKTEHARFLEMADTFRSNEYSIRGVWGDDWTIKDLFAHLTEWEQMFLTWYQQGLRGDEPSLPVPGFKWNQTPELNRAIWKRHAKKPWRRVRADFDKSFRQVLELVESLTEAELLEPGHFPWTRKLPLTSYLGPNSASHYRTATKILQRWRRRRNTTSSKSSGTRTR